MPRINCLLASFPPQDALLAVLPSPHRALRRAAGTTISVVAATGGIQAWPELVAALLQALQSTEPNSLDGALDTLLQVRHAATNLGSAACSGAGQQRRGSSWGIWVRAVHGRVHGSMGSLVGS